MTITALGAWTDFRELNAEDKAVFAQAIQGECGVSYTPRAVATQVVAGLNYCFMCDAQTVTPGAQSRIAYVYIYQAPVTLSQPELKDISKVAPKSGGAMGGWTPFHAVSPADQLIFQAALHGLCGVSYTPTSVATQVVAGLNYCFHCDAKVIYPNAQPYDAYVYIYQPLPAQPKPQLKDITPFPPFAQAAEGASSAPVQASLAA